MAEANLTKTQKKRREEALEALKLYERDPTEENRVKVASAQTNHRHMWNYRKVSKKVRKKICEICWKEKGTHVSSVSKG